MTTTLTHRQIRRLSPVELRAAYAARLTRPAAPQETPRDRKNRLARERRAAAKAATS